jgi:hypothetical protein
MNRINPTNPGSNNSALGIAAGTGPWLKPVQYERKARPPGNALLYTIQPKPHTYFYYILCKIIISYIYLTYNLNHAPNIYYVKILYYIIYPQTAHLIYTM